MYTYSPDSFEKLSELLVERARSLGASGFSIHNEVISLETSMDSCGPVTWALVLHADAMTRLAGIAPPNATNILPVTCVVNPAAPFGNEAISQPGALAMSVALNWLDSALEHAICLGMHAYNYSPAEWLNLPEAQRVVPLEPYITDLQENWITESTDNVAPNQLVDAWPQLYDHDRLEAIMSNRGTLGTSSRALNFPSLR
ncbi:hypothetical protein HMPREF1487_09496 [Pseudomonas sp. HPB0071]|uniref:hypothetical protein n=1 Tax=unclassified Pseudomonas TaxID=196821 RepID=UPI0002CB85FF|nr:MULTISPECIES: hypothetical protein [unclassified Pseudomonas]ENA27017.1 hypothetical protein HMPREF1487_09496 [Pseudomonas sp. HPB0071]